jgi:hypothetical protein
MSNRPNRPEKYHAKERAERKQGFILPNVLITALLNLNPILNLPDPLFGILFTVVSTLVLKVSTDLVDASTKTVSCWCDISTHPPIGS